MFVQKFVGRSAPRNFLKMRLDLEFIAKKDKLYKYFLNEM